MWLANNLRRHIYIRMLAATAPTPDLIANAKQLQQLEAELYSTMEDINKANPQATDTQQKLLKRIADVNVTKQQVFKLIEERYLDANANLSHDKLALGSQIEILQIAEEQLAAASQNITALRDYHSTQERLAGMDEYEFERISADNTMAYTAFLGLAAVAVELFIVNMLPGILAKRNPGNSWKPSGKFLVNHDGNSSFDGCHHPRVPRQTILRRKRTLETRVLRLHVWWVVRIILLARTDAPGETVIQHDELFFETTWEVD